MTLQRPPGPRGHLLFGNVREYQGNSLARELDYARDYGDVVYLRFFHRRAYMVYHPDAVHQVLVTDADKFHKAPIYKLLLTRFLGNGMLTSDGAFWRRQRKLAQPAFHTKRIQAYAEIMTRHAERLLAEWNADVETGNPRAINRDMMRITLNIVSEALFHADVNAQADAVREALQELLEVTDRAVRSPIMGVPNWIPTKQNRRRKAAVETLDAIINGFIHDRRRSGEDTGDLLSMLLMSEDEDGNRMTDRQVRDEAVTLFLAGHETTANALTWTWYLLAQHPEIEANLHDELDRVLGGRTPTLDDLRQLTYTEQVLKESMRLYPPVPSIGRQAMVDMEIGGYAVPKGTIIIISPWVIHKDARWYADPLTFRPERWTREFEKSLPKQAYMPFGGGPRICIGNSFAQMEAVLLLATLAQRYRVRVLPGQTVIPEALLTLRPTEDIPVRLEARQPVVAEARHEAVMA